MTRIKTVTAYITNDGEYHKTEIDAGIHVVCMNAEIAHAKAHLKERVEIQKRAKANIKRHVELDRISVANGNSPTFKENYTSHVQSSIVANANYINKAQKKLNDLRAKFNKQCVTQ